MDALVRPSGCARDPRRAESSRTAVVAREYRLPAVVGAANALHAIPDGARVRVDGSSGSVVLIRERAGARRDSERQSAQP
ncbi:MAG: hypothetical protein DMG02_33680 [Acidobacteria bacterium]|nr:MAG: hypothetical protein DMG02_33680 [Acidobacteriota bacterium]